MLTIVALELIEHTKTLRPSPIILLYLLSSVAADCILIRTLFLRHYFKPISGLVTANMSLKLVFLVLENLSKKKYFKFQDSELSPEETIGIIEKTFFWWINSLLLKGSKEVLTIEDLYPLDSGIESKRLQEDIMNRWPKRKVSYFQDICPLANIIRQRKVKIQLPAHLALHSETPI
jgi:ATP-binding cassette, subfamily C (CFTR/MRP), member 1